MKIGLDMDGCLNMLNEEWSCWIQKLIDPTFTIEKWVSWDLSTLTRAGMSAYDYLWMKGVFARSGIRDGAKEAVRDLQAAGHDVLVVSSSHPNTWVEKNEWLEKHFPEIPLHNRIPCHRKNLIKLDVLVDDGLHNFVGFEGKMGLLLDKPWNRNTTPVNGELSPFIRIDHWNDVPALVNNLTALPN